MARTIVSSTVPRTVLVNNGLATATNLEKGVKLQETRLGHKKLFLPVPLNGMEQPTDRALVYYTATAKMESEGDKVSYRTRLAVLAEILCLESVNGLTIDEIFRTYELQLWDPTHWAIRSYHDNTGATVPSAYKAGTKDLKDIGSDTSNTNAGDIRPKNIMFAYVRVDLTFCHMANCAVKTHLETFLQLPQTTLTVKNGSGRDHTYTSFMGGDVTSYTKEDFQDHILSKTGQQFPAMLASAAVGLSNASLDEETKDDDFRNTLLGVFYPYLKNELFETLCPGLNNNPSDALDRISQDVEFYRAMLKNAAISGAAVINNPFWWSADEKFFNNALSLSVGVPVPKTFLLPSFERPDDTSEDSFSNLKFPIFPTLGSGLASNTIILLAMIVSSRMP